MSRKNTGNKTKAIQLCADMLYDGKQRREIVQELAKVCGCKERAVDNYIKEARPIVKKRQEADEEVRSRVQAEQTEAVARKLGISREWVLSKLKRVADMDIRKLYKEDGTLKKPTDWDDDTASAIAGIEVFEERTVSGKIGINKKVKRDPQLTAISEINKMMGFYPQPTAKVEVEEKGKDGKAMAKKISVTLNLS